MIALVLLSAILSLNSFAAKDFIVENKTSALFIINGTTGNIILTPSFGMVGIGTINPINALTVIGSVTSFGSLNATFINATEIRIGNNLVPVSGAFNNGNYTALEDSAFRISNFTTQLNNYIPSFFNNENFTNLKPFTLTNYSAEYASTGFKIINFTTAYDNRADRFGNANYSSLAPFTLANYSSEYSSSGFKISNFTTNYENQAYFKIVNYTALENAAFTNANYSNLNNSLWNLSRNLILYPKDAAFLVRIGDVNRNISNDTFAVIGSAAVYGSLNSTTFNSSFILQNGNQVQTINAVFNNVNYTALENAAFTNTNYTNLEAAAFNKANYSSEYASSGFKIANYTALENAAFNLVNYSAEYSNSGFKISNFTSNYENQAYFKIANYTALENAAFRIANFTTQYEAQAYFKIANYTALENAAFTNTNYSSLNTTQWNQSGNNIYSKITGVLVGIGTASPLSTLHINSSGADSGLRVTNGSTNFTALFVNSTSGFVGIGTATSGIPLHIASGGNAIVRIQRLGDGAAAALGFMNSTAEKWGIGMRSSTNQFRIFEDGSTANARLVIDSGGNIGVNTTTPGSALTVVGTLNVSRSTSAGDLYVDNNGNVGIGTTVPGQKLTVAGDANISGSLNVSSGLNVISGNVGIGTTGPLNLLHVNSSSGGVLARVEGRTNPRFQVFNGTDSADVYVVGNGAAFGSVTNTPVSLTVSDSIKLHISTAGNIGIGTVTPNYLLQVASGTDGRSVNLSNVLYVNGSSGKVLIGTTSATAGSNGALLEISGTSAATATQAKIFLHDTAGGANSRTWAIANTRGNAADGALSFFVSASADATPSNDPSVTFTKDGNVGIGTTNPSSSASINRILEIADGTSAGIVLNDSGTAGRKWEIFNNDAKLSLYESGIGTVVGLPNGGGMNVEIGNVGIGTTVPGSLLTVAGTINASDIRLEADRPIYTLFERDASADNKEWRIGITSTGEQLEADIVNDARSVTTRWLLVDRTTTTVDSVSFPNGNVGIGATNPGAKLHVAGSINVTGNIIMGTSSSIMFRNRSNTGTFFGIGTNSISSDDFLEVGDNTASSIQGIKFYPGASSPTMTITTGGNVGIGTTVPGGILHTRGTYNIFDRSASDPYLLARFVGTPGTNAALGNLVFQDDSTDMSGIQGRTNPSDASKGELAFYTYNGASYTEKVRIDNTGNVGIGTTGPAEKLTVTGNASISSNFRVVGDVTTIGGGSGSAYLNVNVGESDTVAANIQVRGTNRISILPVSGNVGIGTTGPASTLTVVGNFSATGTKSAVVNTSYGIRKLYAIESPDVSFYDRGRASLTDGIANISLDPIFIETVEPDYQVYLTPEARTSGIYVAEKASNYFIVKGNNPTSNIPFSWLITAMRKGYSETRLDLERKEGNEITAVIDDKNKITEIEIKGNEISKNKNSFNAPGENKTQSANSITGNAIQEIASANNENKFQITASSENEIISQIKQKTKLDESEIKKYLKFKYKKPESKGTEETPESVIPPQQLTKISQVNGSVIIKLG